MLAYTGDWTSWLVTVALLFISTGLYAMLWQARAEAAEARRDLEEYKEAVVKYVKAGMK